MSPSEQPTVKESTNPTSQPTSVPSAPPTQSMVPSNSLSPSANPSESHAPSSITENLCGDMLVDDSEPCVPVSSWDDVVTAIQSSEGRLVFCPFKIQKQPRTAHVINKDIEVVCQRRFPSDGKCSVEGIGTTFIIRGDSSVKLNGFEFKGSESSSVRIGTDGIGAITKICYCDFHSNSRTSSKDGGALFAGDGAGDIYVAFSNFWRNDAERGGAIWSESNKLTVVDSSFFLNSAKDTGSSIYVGESTHLLLRTNRFSYNVGYQTNSNIVVKPGLVLPLDDTQGVYIDAGGNTIDGDDDCKGFSILADNHCQVFHSREADQAIVYPFLRGDLANYDEEWGLALATGLRVRQLAKVNEPVQFGSVETDEDQSKLKFHRDPDGAGVVATPDGGWVYLSNSESTTGDRTGGVFAVIFDAQGEIKGYEPRLTGSTRNCNGGLTPWRTWVSCEEYARGQCWQVDPFGEIESEVITMGGSGGNYEAFAYDDRNEYKPAFFVTEDHDRGALRRFRPIVPTPYPSASPTEEASNSPSSYPSFQATSIPTQSSQSDTFNRRLDGTLKNETWDLLHGEGTIDYLRLVPGTNKFEWTSLLEEGRNSAEEYFPGSEGISCRDGILYFVSKKLFRLFILDLDSMTFTSESTREGLMIGNDGSFTSHGDHLVHLSSDILYFTEDGSTTPGIYGRFTSTGHYFVLLEAIANRFKHDEATGLAFSPDWKRIYFCIQEHGLLFELTREDGKPFEHDERQVSVKSHPGKDHP